MSPTDPQNPDSGSTIPGSGARLDRSSPPLLSLGHPLQGEVLQAHGGLAAPDVGSLLKALRRRWLLALTLGVIAAALGAGATWLFLPNAKNTATARIRIKSGSLLMPTPGQPQSIEITQKTYLGLLRTRSLLNLAVQKLSLDVVRRLESLDSDAVETLEKQMKAEFVGPALLNITVSGDNPEDLKSIVSAIAEAFISEVLVPQRKEKLDLLADYTLELERTKKDLELSTKRLQKLADESGADTKERLISQRNELLMDLNVYKNHLNQIRMEARRVKSTLETREKRLKPQVVFIGTIKITLLVPRNVAVSADALDKGLQIDPKLISLRKEKDDVEKALRGTIAVYKKEDAENQPKVKELREKLRTIEDSMDAYRKESRVRLTKELQERQEFIQESSVAELKERFIYLEAFESALNDTVTEMQGKLSEMGPNGPRVLALEDYQTMVTAARDAYLRVAAAVADLKFDLYGKSGKDEKPAIQDPNVGVTHGNDIKRRSFATAGMGIGSFLFVLFAIAFVEFRAHKINSADEVTLGTGMRIVGTLPALPTRRNRIREGQVDAYWQNLMTESVDAIRTLLLYTARKQDLRVVMVTSAVGGEGKTSLSSHLAASLARAGRNTLLVDCDLRKPAAHHMFDLEREPGFSELLRGEVTLAEAIKPTQADTLSVITAGSCDAVALQALAHGAAGAIFQQLRDQYEFIIVDTAPVLPVADSLLIGEHADAVVFSVLRNTSRMPRVYAAYQRLAMLGIHMFGAVVNGMRADIYGEDYDYSSYASIKK